MGTFGRLCRSVPHAKKLFIAPLQGAGALEPAASIDPSRFGGLKCATPT